MKLRDLGTSAFRGKNLDPKKGDLGKFVALVKSGDIATPCILMLEALDRFSRMPPSVSVTQFTDLVKRGVSVVTLSPEQTITAENVNDMATWLPINIALQIAWEQSREKRRRIGAACHAKQERARTGKPQSFRCPSWLDYTDGKFSVKPEGRRAVQYVFRRTVEGCGLSQLLRELNGKFKSLGYSGHFNRCWVSKVLNDRAVIGEYQPHRFDDAQRRVPEGKPIENYYPAVIPLDLWHRAQSSKTARKKQKGRKSGDFVNLFTGIIFGSDGYPLHIATSRQLTAKGYVKQRRLVSFGHIRGIKGACPYSINYFVIAKIILDNLLHLKASDLMPEHDDTPAQIKQREVELLALDRRIDELAGLLKTKPIAAAFKSLSEMTDRRAELDREIEGMRQQAATAATRPLQQTQDLLDYLRSHRDNHDLRVKLRALVAVLIERVDLNLYKVKGRVEAEIKIKTDWCEAYTSTEKVRGYETPPPPGDTTPEERRKRWAARRKAKGWKIRPEYQ
jgi:hypothetical protein